MSGPYPPFPRPLSFLLLQVRSNFLKMNQAVCDRRVVERGGGWGLRLTVYPSIWERFPLAGKKQFPDLLVLARPALTSFLLAACQLRCAGVKTMDQRLRED